MGGDKQFSIGIDIGGTTLKAALLDGDLGIRKKAIVKTPAKDEIQELIADIKTVVDRFISDIPRSRLWGVGIGCPGLVDSQAGVVKRIIQLPCWSDVPLQRLVEDAVSLPVVIEHDLRVVTLGEMHRGAGRRYSDFVNATIGTGIGISIVIGGEIYERPTGDWGHITIDYRGRLCPCGNIGCLETIAAGPSIARTARDRISAGANSILPSFVGGEMQQVEASHVFAAAKQGDDLCQGIVREVGEALGYGVVSLVAILNPEVVIIGGGVARCGESLFSQIRKTVAERSWCWGNPHERIIPAQLGEEAGMIGAGVLVRQRLNGKQAPR